MKNVLMLIVTLLAISFVSFIEPVSIQAEVDYVNECLEQPESCEEPLIEEEEQDQPVVLQEEETGSLFFELVRLVFALLLVLGLIYASLYFLKRRNKIGNRIDSLENVGGISVGQNKSVQLVRLGDRIYLIGVGENVTLLEEVEDQSIIKEIMQAREEQSLEMSAKNMVSSAFQHNKTSGNKDKPFNKLFQQELNRLQKKRRTIIDRRKEDQE